MLWTEALETRFDRHARERGQDYEALGRVSLVRAGDDGAEATVRGTRLYRVYVSRGSRGVSLSCTCPRFETTPCKHVWATLLALDRGGRRGVAGPDRTIPPLPPQARPVPPWQARLDHLASRAPAADPEARAAWPAGREVVYEVDLPSTLEGRGVVVGLFHRQRRKDTTWGRLKPLKAGRRMIEALPDPADREALSWLLGGHNIDSYYSYDPYEVTGSARFRLSDPLELRALPALCATGRCVLRVSTQGEPSTLAWDAGGAWRFAIRVTAEADRFVLEGALRRGGEERSLAAATLVTASGLVFMDGSAAPFDHGAAFSWVADLRRHSRLEVPRAEERRLRAALLSTARRPPVELPDELGIEEVRLAPSPRLRIVARDGVFRGERELVAEPSFQYGDAVVPAEAPGWAVAAATPPTVYVRDPEAERALLERVRAVGVNRSAYHGRDDGRLRLSPARLAALVSALTHEGWHVEAEGHVYRRPGATSLRVSSGIDWFELEGAVDFEGQRVALPRLLQALRRGESAVVLDDGSLGMLPEEWLRRQAPLARFGEVEGEVVRFKPSQAGLLDALLASQPEVETDAAFERARGALRRFEGIGPLAAPSAFVGRLRAYQELGLGWMAFLREFGFGGCLADDMGLGKTVQVLALLESRRTEGKKPSLVVVPRSLVFNWMEEAARFAPRLRVLDHTGLARARTARALGDADVVLTTYGTLRRDAALLEEVAFDYVVLDEAQAIKNKATESAKAARLLRADHRVALSGTPVENHLGELQSLFEFLNPGLLGRMPLARGDGEIDEEGRAALARGIAPFILRRTKEQVAKDLPPKTEQTLWCDLEPGQKALCDELRDHYRKALLERVDRQGLGRSKIQVLEALLRMRQAACHPGLVDPRYAEGPSAKLDALVPRLVEIVEEGHKALVFSQFTSFLALLKPRLLAAGLVHEYLDGKTRDRAARVKRFEADAGCGVFLISLKAGGLGLNLTAAEYVFLLDPWWNPAVEAQAVDRAHRIGQARPVFAYRLVARGTVEEKVLALQEKKRALADAIVRADESVLRGLRREDLELLLS
jgi:superfamily II DNA or RNA helicase